MSLCVCEYVWLWWPSYTMHMLLTMGGLLVLLLLFFRFFCPPLYPYCARACVCVYLCVYVLYGLISNISEDCSVSHSVSHSVSQSVKQWITRNSVIFFSIRSDSSVYLKFCCVFFFSVVRCRISASIHHFSLNHNKIISIIIRKRAKLVYRKRNMISSAEPVNFILARAQTNAKSY